MSACPVNAIAVDEQTGAKVVLEDVCVGCHLCSIACPFGTVFTLPVSGKAAKCNLCGGQPACAAACPTLAIEWKETDGVGQWFEPWEQTIAQRHREALVASA